MLLSIFQVIRSHLGFQDQPKSVNKQCHGWQYQRKVDIECKVLAQTNKAEVIRDFRRSQRHCLIRQVWVKKLQVWVPSKGRVHEHVEKFEENCFLLFNYHCHKVMELKDLDGFEADHLVEVCCDQEKEQADCGDDHETYGRSLGGSLNSFFFEDQNRVDPFDFDLNWQLWGNRENQRLKVNCGSCWSLLYLRSLWVSSKRFLDRLSMILAEWQSDSCDEVLQSFDVIHLNCDFIGAGVVLVSNAF